MDFPYHMSILWSAKLFPYSLDVKSVTTKNPARADETSLGYSQY